MNVSVNKVNEARTSVLKQFTGKVPEKVPSKGIRSKLVIDAWYFADIQVVYCSARGSRFVICFR